MTPMQKECHELSARQKQVQELLLRYLLATVRRWPGAESMTLDDVLSAYHQAAMAGQVPHCEELLRLHPELITELQIFFAVQEPATSTAIATTC
jgi:hypothetical protein